MVNGNKTTCEKLLVTSFKFLQKSNKKLYSEIIKLSIINSTPVFRIINLKPDKKKKRKKKGNKIIKQTPGYFSTNYFRISNATKFIVKASINKKRQNKILSKQLKNEFILNARNEGDAVSFKDELQKQALIKKHLFKYYKW